MSAPSICFLLDRHEAPHNDNHRRLPRAFEACGWRVLRAGQETLCLDAGRLMVSEQGTLKALHEFDLVWHLGLGVRNTFLDRMESLSMLPNALLVTPAQALTLRHGKLHLIDPLLVDMLPDSYASACIDFLLSRITEGDWVIKPAAGSFGEDVVRVSAKTPNLQQMLEQACARHFVVAQRFVPLGGQPETRVLFAEGRMIGNYGRLPQDDQPGNLARGGTAAILDIDAGIKDKIARLEQWLGQQGIGFAAADFRAGHLIEINIANPGGLATIEQLSGEDLAPRVVEELSRRVFAQSTATRQHQKNLPSPRPLRPSSGDRASTSINSDDRSGGEG